MIGPDLKPTISRLPVTCPGGQGTCTTTFRYRVDNIGSARRGVRRPPGADPALGTTTTLAVAGLPAGGTTGPLSVTLGPANNCFDPDCTISVKADSGNAVVESNEANNTDTSTTPG